MNSLLNKNLDFFKKRFPQLAETITDDLIEQSKKLFTISESRSGEVTASYNNLALHSSYAPQKEALRLIQTAELEKYDAGVFFGFGLGYSPITFANLFPSKTLIMIEPEPVHFLAALHYVDWEPVFMHNSCVLLLGAPQQTVIAVLEKVGIKKCFFFQTKSQIFHAEKYFTALQTLIERNKQKKEINERTLERFSTLWLKNMCKNVKYAYHLDGVAKYKDKFKNMPACLIAAGPSLDGVLPHLKEIQEKCVTVCVDTSLKACIKAGIQPDFVVSVDPQYWNVRHLDGLKAPETTLITEMASYPSTFRFECKETLLCSSLYPLGKFIEKRTGSYGELGAGGSVATTAWDFARLCGCRPIYVAGLDLGFPENKTHFKGGTFEERAHRLSSRLHPAEIDSYNALYGAYPYFVKDYNGNPILTDQRMALYAWWFESKCCEFPEAETKTITPESSFIPGIKKSSIDEIKELADCKEKKQAVKEESVSKIDKTEIYRKTLEEAEKQLHSIKYNAEKAKNLCEQSLNGKAVSQSTAKKLQEIDYNILHNDAAELASLVFPGENKMEKLQEGIKNPYEASLIVYKEIIKSVNKHLFYLEK